MVSEFEKKMIRIMHHKKISADDAFYLAFHEQSVEEERIEARAKYFAQGVRLGILTNDDVYRLEQEYQNKRYGVSSDESRTN